MNKKRHRTGLSLQLPCQWLLLVLSLLSLISLSPLGPAAAHPADELCAPGSSLDPELCRQLSALDANKEVAGLPAGALAQRGLFETMGLYLTIGVRHILPGGADHILFVLALFLATQRARPLLLQISAFTVAHTFTLALAATGQITLPAQIIEPLIAATIAWVAIENLLFKNNPPWRLLLIFGFGLIHGLGFAGFIREVGLPEAQLWPALIGFNIGVEFGQVAVIGLAAILTLAIRPWLNNSRFTYQQIIAMPGSLLIGATGFFWFATRLPNL